MKTAYKRISDEAICGTRSVREAASEQSSRDKSCRTLSSSKTVSCQSVWNMICLKLRVLLEFYYAEYPVVI